MSSQEKVCVRTAQRRDIESLVLFGKSMALETESVTLDEGTLSKGVRAVFDSSDKGFYVVAELEGRTAGSLMITYEWSDWRNAWWWWIQSVYVLPEFRRRGVYRALHEWVAREASTRAPDVFGLRLYVDRHNTNAQLVYERMGLTRSRYDFFEQQFAKR